MRQAVKVLYLDHTASISGGEVALLNLLRHLDRTRVEPLVTLFADGPLRERLAEANVATSVLPLNRNIADVRKDSLDSAGVVRGLLSAKTVGFVFRLSRAIRRSGAHLVHTNSLKADLIGGCAARLAGVPVVWHVRDRIADDYLPVAAGRFFRYLCRHLPAHVIANSRATLQTLQLPPRRPASPIHSGVSLGDDGAEGRGARSAWHMTGRMTVVHDGLPDLGGATGDTSPVVSVIGLIGRIAPWKGQHVFLEAAKRVRTRHPDARFLIVGAPLFGEQAYEAQVRQQCSDLGLDEVVEFTGFRDDIPEIVAGLSVLVHASTVPEPFGQVVVEGMVAGKPVVATRGGGVPEVVIDGTTGLLVPMGDSDAMAGAILQILADPARAAEMGAAGRSRALSEFSIEQTARKVEAVYDLVLAGRRRGVPGRS